MHHRTAVWVFCLAFEFLASSAGAEPLARSWARPESEGPSSAIRAEGVSGLSLLRVRVAYSTPTGRFSDDADAGPGLGASIGYGVSRIAVVSFGVGHHELGRVDPSAARYSITPVTMDVDFFVPSDGRVQPWFGGGLGFYYVTRSRAGALTERRAHDSDLGFNMGAGVGAPISDRTRAGVGVRLHQFLGSSLRDAPFYSVQMEMGFRM